MNERNNKLELLGSAPIPKALMALGIPIMIGMLINALYNLVDAYFVSGLGKSQMGAISVVCSTHRRCNFRSNHCIYGVTPSSGIVCG